jgi:hypothetical protein
MVAAHAKSAFTVSEMKALLKSKYVGKSKGKNDRIEKNRGGVSYYLFGNEIAHYNPSTRVLSLTDARWRSSTTKNRLNLLGANITQKDFAWYTTKNGRVVEWTGTKSIRV